MEQNKPKIKIKDSVFTDMFRNKKYVLELYQYLHPEDTTTTEDDIEIVTLNPVLVDAIYNDLGFSVNDKQIILVESQSTWSINIVARAFMYLVQTYHEFFERTKQNLYTSKKIYLPKAELYVVFTGESPKNPPDDIVLSRDFFSGEETALDVTVKVLYQEDAGNIIGQYVIFCKALKEQIKQYGMTTRAVQETIRICKDRNVLKEYLESREQEVVTFMDSLFNQDRIMEQYVYEKQQDAAREAAANFIRDGLPLERIARCMPSLTLDEIKKIAAEIGIKPMNTF
ncbi:MAG: hypothetical protein NC089_07035 [Bacteroides sp.]|nr:hypothetical protein [Bacteroides sp.]MCM1548396.1 hypothetical protein [Clostridium sp.]